MRVTCATAGRMGAMTSTTLTPAWPISDGEARARAQFVTSFGSAGGTRDAGGLVYGSAPGRVNLIGEHTDYNGGLSLPIALPHRTFVAARARSDTRVHLASSDQEPWQGDLRTIGPGTVSGWGTYVAGVAWALAREGVDLPGFDLAVASCVPFGAGLSSSAALECATLMALSRLAGPDWTGPDLATDEGRAWAAQVCVRAENEIAGAPTGGMDQAASLRCVPGHALLLDMRSGTAEQVPFDPSAAGLELLVIDTRAEHALVDGQYAERRRSCETAAATLGVATLREIPLADLDAALALLPDGTTRARVRHVVSEIDRVTQFTRALRETAWDRAGSIMDASHSSLAGDYEVSSAELDTAVRAARNAGALGARMTGGGFGGSAIALVPAGRAAQVSAAVATAFARAGHHAPAFLLAPPSDPAG